MRSKTLPILLAAALAVVGASLLCPSSSGAPPAPKSAATAPAAATATPAPPAEAAPAAPATMPAASPGIPAPVATTIPDPAVDPGDYVAHIMDSLTAGDWRLLAVLLGLGVIYALRQWGGMLVPWLKTDRGGALLAILYGIALPIVGIAISKTKWSLAVIVGGVLASASATGLYVWLKRLISPKDNPAPALPVAKTGA